MTAVPPGTRAMILAAGLGTRLGELSDERPKPLLPVADWSLIRWTVALLVGHGVREIVVNLHHRGELIEHELGDGAALGARIVYSREAPAILGTGGGIRRALPLLGEQPFLVLNGKIVVDVDLGELLARHRAAGAEATLVLRRDAEAARWGAVDAPAGGGRLRGFFGGGEHMFTGIHVIEPALVARLPDDGVERCIVRQGYVPWLAGGARIDAYELPAQAYFMEHSTPERYLAGNVNVLRGRALVPFAPGPVVGVDAAAQVAANARIVEPVRVAVGAVVGEGAVIGPDAVIGAGAVVAPGVRVERAVVWPGARVERDAVGAIVTTRAALTVKSGG